jgi:hypothetical protein
VAAAHPFFAAPVVAAPMAATPVADEYVVASPVAAASMAANPADAGPSVTVMMKPIHFLFCLSNNVTTTIFRFLSNCNDVTKIFFILPQ